MIPTKNKAPIRTMAEPNGKRATECSIPVYATALNAKLIPISKTKLIHRAPEIHKGKLAAYFSTQEEVELAKDCKYKLIGKFSHGRPSIEDIRSDFAARFALKGQERIGHYNSKHVFLDFNMEEDFLNIYSRKKILAMGALMHLVTWTIDFNPEEETPLTPVWILLPELKWHCYNWDALLRITSPLGTLLKIDKATELKSRPNFAKVLVEIDLTKQRRESVWVGIKNDEGKKCGGSYQAIEYEFVPEYCFKCKHQDHYEDECMALPKADRPPQRGHRRDWGFQTWASSDQLDIPNITRNASRPQALAQSSHGTQVQEQNVVTKTNIDELSKKAIAAPAKLATNSKTAKSMKRHKIQNGIRAKLTTHYEGAEHMVKHINATITAEQATSIPVKYSFQHLNQLQEDPKQPQISKRDQEALHDSFVAQHRPNN